MNKVDVAGLKIDAISKTGLLKFLDERLKSSQKTFVTTLYSEFLYAALRDDEIKNMLNRADFAVADGIGVIWAAKFLSLPLTFKNYWLKILQAIWQAKYSILSILFYPAWVKSIVPEKIVGADLIWDLVKLAKENNLSIYLLGGFGDTPKLVAEKIENYETRINRGRDLSKSTNKLVAGYSNKNPNDPTIIDDIKKASPDLLFVAFGPIKQEKWIAQNYENLPVKLTIGLGGSFDYIAGKRGAPPQFLRYIGLEWLWRLITQPHRAKRIIQATWGLSWALIRYKVFSSYGLRPNVAIVILNKQNEILICQRHPNNFKIDVIGSQNYEKRKNYWQFPQGGIDEGENLEVAAQREANEETGLKDLEFIKISANTNTYIRYNAFRKFWPNRKFKDKGQKQNIVYFKFSGSNKDVKIDNNELSDFQWVRPEMLEKIIHPERISLIKIVKEDLKQML